MKQMWSRLERHYPVLLAYRRKVDADYVRQCRSRLYGANLIPLFVALISLAVAPLVSGPAGWLLLLWITLLLLLQLFHYWRVYRMDKAKRYWNGRYFERRARYVLSPEYHDSEDALLAAWRRKRAKSV